MNIKFADFFFIILSWVLIFHFLEPIKPYYYQIEAWKKSLYWLDQVYPFSHHLICSVNLLSLTVSASLYLLPFFISFITNFCFLTINAAFTWLICLLFVIRICITYHFIPINFNFPYEIRSKDPRIMPAGSQDTCPT